MKIKDVFGILDYATIVIIGSNVNLGFGIGIAISILFVNEITIMVDLEDFKHYLLFENLESLFMKLVFIVVGSILSILYPVLSEIALVISTIWLICISIVFLYLWQKKIIYELRNAMNHSVEILLNYYEGR